ncbi:30917_t:CDS:2, partial [Racocetra persica]
EVDHFLAILGLKKPANSSFIRTKIPDHFELEAEAIAGNQHNKQELTLAYDLTNRKVVGKIDLSPFTNLEKLDIRAGIFPHLDTSKCAGLPIRELIIYTSSDTEDFDLKDFPNLVKLSAFGYDPIRNLDLTANTKLEEIELSGETARTLDLKTFSHLTNLKKLELGYANGSFKSLEHCTNLEYL